MIKEDGLKKGSQPKLVVLNKASKLAEKWVNEMSGSFEYSKSSEVQIEGRPERLGIGATVPRRSKYVLSSDPVERKLRAKLEAEKKKGLKCTENSGSSGLDVSADEDIEEEESKAESFSKKRPMIPSYSQQAKKSNK